MQVLPITRNYPNDLDAADVRHTAFEKPSVVQLEQIFTIDKSRIQRFLGQTTRREMRRIEEALLNSLEINEWDRRNADE